MNWLAWNGRDVDDEAFYDFVRKLITYRRNQPLLKRKRFLHGRYVAGKVRDVTWIRPSGAEMRHEDWSDPDLNVLGLMHCDETGSALLVLINGSEQEVRFHLPRELRAAGWKVVMRTDTGQWPVWDAVRTPADLGLPERTLILLEGRIR